MRPLHGVIFFATVALATSSASAQRKRPLGSGFAKQRQTGNDSARTTSTSTGAPKPSAPSGELGNSRPAGKTAPTTAHLSRSGKPLTSAERKAIEQRSRVEEKQRQRETSKQKVTAARSKVADAEARVAAASRQVAGAQQRLSRAVRDVEELQNKIDLAESRLIRTRRDAEDAIRRANAVGKKRTFLSQVVGALTFGLVVDRKVDQRLQEEALELVQEVDDLERFIPTLQGRFREARRDLAVASDQLASARADDSQARQELEPLLRTTRQLTAEADQAERDFAQATADLTAAEAEAERAVTRYMKRRALQDQHRMRLASESDRATLRASYTRYRTAAKRFQLTSLIEPKPGEYSQDAVAAAPEEGIFAISDGVSQSEFPGEFARSLVKVYTARKPAGADEFAQVLEEAQQAWNAETGERIAAARQNWFARNTNWVASATFLGARLEGTGKRQRLKLVGLGDSNLFIVRGDKIVKAWPQERADQFSQTVKALRSTEPLKGTIPSASIPVRPGDEVFMATDALSAWILTEVEAGRDPFPLLRDIKNQRQLNEFVERARDKTIAGRAQMAEDDTTLLRFVVPGEGSPETP